MTENNVYTQYRSGRGSEKGNVLILTLVIASVLLIISVWSYRAVLTQNVQAHNSYKFQQALSLAESGVDLAIHELNRSDENEMWDDWTEDSGDYTRQETITDDEGNPLGDFSVYVSDIGSGTPVVEATGYLPDQNDPRFRRTVRVEVVQLRNAGYFDWGIFAYGDQEYHGGFHMTSWHADDGEPSQSHQQNNDFGNIGGMGDATFDNGTQLHGSLVVAGEILPPNILGDNPDGDPNEVRNEVPNSPADFPDDEFEQAKVVNDNLTGITVPRRTDLEDFYDPVTKKLTISSNNTQLKLSPGVYFFNEIEITGNNSGILIDPEGPVEIYVDGDFTMSNHGILNDEQRDQDPRNMLIFQKSGDIFWDNGARFNAAVFAPNSSVYVDNAAHMFGAIVSNDLYFGGGGHMCYDESLSDLGSTNSGARAASWLEISPQS